jgi:hypothetical protein
MIICATTNQQEENEMAFEHKANRGSLFRVIAEDR